MRLPSGRKIERVGQAAHGDARGNLPGEARQRIQTAIEDPHVSPALLTPTPRGRRMLAPPGKSRPDRNARTVLSFTRSTTVMLPSAVVTKGEMQVRPKEGWSMLAEKQEQSRRWPARQAGSKRESSWAGS